jgi:exopolysaccharide production negative regulator
MLAERRKWFAMRISSGVLVLALMVCAGAASASPPERDLSGQVELEQGLTAYKTGSYAAALPALKEAAANGNETAKFFAEFYMARIYADNGGTLTDHPKAFMLFRKLADENADIDPDGDHRSPFVAKAFIALAGYMRGGLREISVPPNPRRAANYLHHAAIFFGDKEAQFELAKLYLSGEGGNDDVRRGLHYLSALSEQSYPAAQALLAELLWKGRFVQSDERRALALITMAAENAPAHDRIWIDETYHSIYCATTQGTRQEATGLMARWRKMFARPVAEPLDRAGLGGRELQPERQCSNGEAVAIRRAGTMTAARPAAPPAAQPEVMQGSAVPFGFRAAGGAPPTTGSTK